jgi:mono/diheme cytochrome c family protein
VSFRASLMILNGLALIALVGFLVYRVMSVRRNPDTRPPANVAPGMGDADLEGRKLERVLGWSLIFTIIIAVALPLYFLVEPQRQATAEDAFLERSIARGAILFANNQSPHYDSTTSLLCANCHGVDGGGGTAPYTLQPEADKCLQKKNQGKKAIPECLPRSVNWQAPDLTLAPLRYEKGQLRQIITFGRPGTPMPAWGVKSGRGSKDEQSIDDLVNYLESIKVTPEKAKADADKAIEEFRQAARDLVLSVDKDGTRSGKTVDLENAEAALQKVQNDPAATPDDIAAAQEKADLAQAELDQAIAWRDQNDALPDGGILFRLNCARCHTKGWSYHVTEPARTDLPTLAPDGSGAFGPPLIGNSVELQFPGKAGVQEQFNWVAIGVPANNLYGARGISTGRMPHFGLVLTDEQIKAIIRYERSL